MFCLPDDFVMQYANKEPEWGPIGKVTYNRTYARALAGGSERLQRLAETFGVKGSEEWWLTCVRVIEGVYEIQRVHCAAEGRPWNEEKAVYSAKNMFKLMFSFKFLPPGRGLWAMGSQIVDKLGGAALNNCAFVSTKDIGKSDKSWVRPFAFLMDMSMLGVGVGIDVQGAGTFVIQCPGSEPCNYTIEDSREGWVNALCMLLMAFTGKWAVPTFDYSQVRPAGSPIKTFGGVSEGPEPLMLMMERLNRILDKNITRAISAEAITDIANVIGCCVVAGNVRRSAEIVLGDPKDKGFLALKDNPSSERMQTWGWASNNSVFVKVGENYSELANHTAKAGEPGYFWRDNARQYGRMKDPQNWNDWRVEGCNPCGEQSLEDGELCCLVETFPSLHDSFYDYQRTLKYAYLYAKTVTLVKTHNLETNQVIERNRRIGCSMSGVTEALAKYGRRTFLEWCDSGYKYLRTLDDRYSAWFGVANSIKITSIKPSGTVSLLPGVSPGMHWPISEHYWRVIRFSAGSDYLDGFRASGLRCVDLSPNEPNTVAVYFPVKVKNFSKAESEVSVWEQVKLAADLQHYWADNQVSCTIKFRPEEAKDLLSILECYETSLKSVSFLPHSDHGYSHAPYQPISVAEYEIAMAQLSNAIISGGHETEDKFCEGAACEISQASG